MNSKYVNILIVIGIGIGIALFFLLFILAPNKNVINAKFTGTVFYKGSEEVHKNYTLYFYNYFYEKGDMYSATPLKIESVTTDSSGKYFIILEKSNYVHIDTIPNIQSTPIKRLNTRKENVVNFEL